jgi:hypothetical protein
MLLRSVVWRVKSSGSRLRWLLWTSSCLITRQFLKSKTSCVSANLWRANSFFFFIWFCVTCVLKFSFAMLMKFGVSILIFFFFNKITDFHSGFSFPFLSLKILIDI